MSLFYIWISLQLSLSG